jgi:adenylate cyclase
MEIERKFLVQPPFPDFRRGKKITQAYIFVMNQKEMRVRICNSLATITIKISKGGMSREDFECPMPLADALNLIEVGSTCPPIEKTRYDIYHEAMKWEVDVFEGTNKGLILAEIELESEDQVFSKPLWVGDEVTYDKRYYNSYLYSAGKVC